MPQKLAPRDRVLQSEEGAPRTRPTSTKHVALSNYQVPEVLLCR